MVLGSMYNCIPKQQQQHHQQQHPEQDQSQHHQQQQQLLPVQDYNNCYNPGGGYSQFNNRDNDANTPPDHVSLTIEQQRQHQFYNYDEQQQQQQLATASSGLHNLSPPLAVPAAGNVSMVAAAANDSAACWPSNGGYQTQRPLAATAATGGYEASLELSSVPHRPSHLDHQWSLGGEVPHHYNSYPSASDDDGDMPEDRTSTEAAEYMRFVSSGTRRPDNFEHSSMLYQRQQGGGEGSESDYNVGLRRGVAGLPRVLSAQYVGSPFDDVCVQDRLGAHIVAPKNEFSSVGSHSTASHMQAPFDWMKKQSYPIIPICGRIT